MARGKQLTRVSISVAASGDTTIVAAQAGRSIYVQYLELVNTSAVATTFIMKSGATAMNGAGYTLNAGDQYIFNPLPQNVGEGNVAQRRDLATASGAAFVINLSGANQHSGFALYSVET